MHRRLGSRRHVGAPGADAKSNISPKKANPRQPVRAAAGLSETM